MNTDDFVQSIMWWGRECYPEEACGLILRPHNGGPEFLIWTANMAANPRNEFFIPHGSVMMAGALGEVVGSWHTHAVLPPAPSTADRAVCDYTGKPMLIVSVPSGNFAWVKPGASPALAGRPYLFGMFDCGSLLVDYYAAHGVTVVNPPRTPDFYKSGDFLRTVAEQSGFVAVSKPWTLRPHDALLFKAADDSPEPDHSGVYLGSNLFLHHLRNRQSRQDILIDYWLNRLTYVYRHPSFK